MEIYFFIRQFLKKTRWVMEFYKILKCWIKYSRTLQLQTIIEDRFYLGNLWKMYYQIIKTLIKNYGETNLNIGDWSGKVSSIPDNNYSHMLQIHAWLRLF